MSDVKPIDVYVTLEDGEMDIQKVYLAADYDALKSDRHHLENNWLEKVKYLHEAQARVAELESALRLAKPCVERDLKAAVKENFGYVNNDPWACAAVDARNAIDAALAGQQQQGEPHNCELEGGHLPIGWGGLVFCELCSARLPDEPALAEAEQPVIYPEDDPDERAALSTALFNALESYEASRGNFSRKDQKIHAKQCELIRQHAAQLLAGQPAQPVVSEPVAWQWLNTAHFRRKIPAYANACHWEPLYRHPPAIPEGYALVPIELTEAMRDAGNIYSLNRATLMRIWADMIAAAPQSTHGVTDR